MQVDERERIALYDSPTYGIGIDSRIGTDEIETGYRRPTPVVTAKIARALDVPQVAITLPDYEQIRDPADHAA